MVPATGELLFREPQGRRIALVQFAASVVFLSMFSYAWSVGDAGETWWILFLVVGTALSGIAESLPENRRQAAGLLRFAGILVLLVLVAATFAGFEFLVGVSLSGCDSLY